MGKGCCDSVDITKGTTIVSMIKGHRYEVVIVFCKNCGSQKSTSHIRLLEK